MSAKRKARKRPGGPRKKRIGTIGHHTPWRALTIYCVVCKRIATPEGCDACGASLQQILEDHATVEALQVTAPEGDCCGAAALGAGPRRPGHTTGGRQAAHWRHDHTNYDQAWRNIERRFRGHPVELEPAMVVLRERCEQLR